MSMLKSGKYNDPLHVGWDQLTVKYNDKDIFILNKALLDRQLCWENLEEIKETHWLKCMFYEMIMETDDAKELKELGKDLTECEFYLQELWKFEKDTRFHRFWEYPKCTCPKMDNNDSWGSGYNVVTKSCPLHGF